MKTFRPELTLYWNRKPGVFVSKFTGVSLTVNISLTIGPTFTGTVREWYETLVETVIDLRNQLSNRVHGTLQSVEIKCDPDVWCMLNCSVLFRPDVDGSLDKGVISDMKITADKCCKQRQIQMLATFRTRDGAIVMKDGAVNVIEE